MGFLFLCVPGVGCGGVSTGSSSDAGAGPSSDAGGSDASVEQEASTRDAGDASKGDDQGEGGSACGAPVCNHVVNDAQTVTTVDVPGAMPALAGGAIADGTYLLTAVEAYGGGGSAGQKARITFVFKNGDLEITQDGDCNAAPTGSATFTTSGSAIDVAYRCPIAGEQKARYEATPTTFAYTTNTGASGILFRFTKK